MRHARRLGAAAVASSVSLLTTFGIAEGIHAAQAPSTPTASGTQVGTKQVAAGNNGPSRLLVIRRATPTQASSSSGTIYLQSTATTSTTTPSAPVAQAPAPPPTTQTS